MLYSEAWRHRNEIRHDPVKYKEFVCDWYNKVNEMIKGDNRPEVLKYTRIQALDLEFICCISHIIVVNPTYVCMYLAFMRHATIVLHQLPGSDLQYNFKILPEHQLQNLKQTEQ